MTKLSTLTASTALSRTVPASLAGGATLPVTARKILAVNEQIAGSTFNIPYTAENDYVQENAATGTDAAGGAFTLANSAGAAIDANTKLLIHADGVHGSTEIVDERGITLFGNSCAYFDGASYWKVPGSYKTAFGTAQDFTVELWARGIGNGVNTQRLVSVADAASSVESFFISWNGSNLFSTLVNGGSGWTSIGSCSPDSWYHIAVVRRSGVYYTYLNGVAGMTSSAGSSLGAQSITIGAARDGTNPFSGWQDQIRISKIARYTGAFTPPTGAFTTDPDTVYLFQFDDGHGSQFVRDASRSGNEIGIYGSAAISTTRAKFGSSSLAFTTTSDFMYPNTTKDYGEFALTTDDFTVDFWVYLTSLSGEGYVFSGGTAFSPLITVNSAPSNAVYLYLSSNGSSWDLANKVSIGSIATGVWTHIALVRSGTNVYGFVNGVLGGTVAASTASLWPSARRPQFGRYNGVATAFLGNLDEVRLKRGQAVWTSNFTPPSSPYTTDDYTVLLCHFEGANGDKVTLDSSESSYGINGFGDTTTPFLELRNGAALSTAQTRGGNSTSLALNGTNQYANITCATPSAGHPLYFAAWEQFCIEGWFYQSNFTGTQRYWSLSNASNTPANQLNTYVTTGGVPTFGTGAVDIATGPTLSAGWNHIAVVRDGRGWTVYSNGVAGTTAQPQTNPAYASEVHTLCLGSWIGSGNFLSGAIDCFRITHGKPRYTANFTPGNLTQDADTALLWVFNGASGQKWVKELSKNTALIQATGARTVRDGRFIEPVLTSGSQSLLSTTAKFGIGSLYAGIINGNYYRIGHQADFCPTGDYTFDLWVRPTSTGLNSAIFDKRTGTISTSSYMMYFAANKIAWQHFNAGTATTIVGTTTLTAGAWYHVAVTLSGTTLRLFVNGVQEATGAVISGLTGSPTAYLVIGNQFDGTAPATSYIDELRISSTARWTANFTPPTLPYGQQYATGPFWVATKPGTSSLDLSAFSSIDNAAFTGAEPATTTLRFLISTDAYASALKVWNGSAWVSSGYAMSWNAGAGTLTTAATAAQLSAAGNSWAQLAAGLVALDVSDIASLNIVAVLATANQTYTPVLDAITLTMDEYVEMIPGSDYTVRFKDTAPVAQPMTVTRTKPGTGNVSVTYLP